MGDIVKITIIVAAQGKQILGCGRSGRKAQCNESALLGAPLQVEGLRKIVSGIKLVLNVEHEIIDSAIVYARNGKPAARVCSGIFRKTGEGCGGAESKTSAHGGHTYLRTKDGSWSSICDHMKKDTGGPVEIEQLFTICVEVLAEFEVVVEIDEVTTGKFPSEVDAVETLLDADWRILVSEVVVIVVIPVSGVVVIEKVLVESEIENPGISPRIIIAMIATVAAKKILSSSVFLSCWQVGCR